MTGVKFINKCKIFTIIALISLLLVGCQNDIGAPYNSVEYKDRFELVSLTSIEQANGFASDLCVGDDNKEYQDFVLDNVGAAGIFSISDNEIVYSNHIYAQMYPASITKVLTALVAIKYGNLDQVLTATENVYINESGAVLLGLKPGDSMTLEQALHFFLIKSANDVGNLIAENVGGSIENFVNMMNEEARLLGATKTNFVNTHGLHDNEHYTTVYDQYLIFQEAIKYDAFNQIISQVSYTSTYKNANGEEVSVTVNSTNGYFNGMYEKPNGVTVLGGKTGTTNEAGHCLMIHVKDNSGRPYIAIMFCGSTRSELYFEMSEILEKIGADV